MKVGEKLPVPIIQPRFLCLCPPVKLPLWHSEPPIEPLDLITSLLHAAVTSTDERKA